MAVYGYTRVSTTEQAADDRSSLDTQRRKIVAAAELAGLSLDGFVEEPGVSGSKPLADRPEGGPLLARLGKGRRVDLSPSWTGLSATRPMPSRRRSS